MSEEHKKEGFSYSDSSRDKTAFTILGVEFVAILIVIVLIFGILNYFLIFPLSIMNPKLFGWLPVSKNLAKFKFPDEKVQVNNIVPVQKGRDPRFLLTPTLAPVTPKLEAISDISGVSLVLDDKEKLIQLLQEWMLYGRNYDDPNYGSTKGKILANVTIHLTDQKQPAFQLIDKGGVYVGTGYKIDTGKIEILVYIPGERITRDMVGSEYTFNKQALFSLYALAKQVDTTEEYKSAMKVINTIIEAQKSDNNYFMSIK